MPITKFRFIPSESVISECRSLALGRNANNRYGGVKDRRISDRYSGLEIDYMGILGEYAFKEWFGLIGLPVVLDRADKGWDFELGGLKVDVKTSPFRDTDFKIPQRSKLRADVYVMLEFRYNPDIIIESGWLDINLFNDKKKEPSWGKVPTWMVEKGDLYDLDGLLTWYRYR